MADAGFDDAGFDAPPPDVEMDPVYGDNDGDNDGPVFNDNPEEMNDNPDEDYQQHWGSSLETEENGGEDEDEDEEIPFVDDLPIFADASSKALHAETKQLEARRDLAEKEAAANKERVAIMNEHLKNVNQEVDHTNNLVAAKNKEIQSEEHLQALAAREQGRYQTEIK